MQTIQQIDTLIKSHEAVVLYFSSPGCGVCKVLKPKLFDALDTTFALFVKESIDISLTPEIGSHFGVFAIPTVLVYLDGKEFIRKSRNMSVEGLLAEIERPYQIMMS